MERSSFVFYKEWKDAISGLPDDQRLEVYESVIEYATSGKVPMLKPMAGLAFNFIKTTIDRDIERYMSIVERNRNNGNNGGRPKKETQTNPKNPVGYLETQTNPKNLDNDNDNVGGSLNDFKLLNSNEFELLGINAIYNFDKENEFCQCETKLGKKCRRKSCYEIGEKNYCNQHARKLIEKSQSLKKFENRKKIFMDQCAEFVEKYGKEIVREFFDYWTEPNKSKSKMRFELQKTWDLSRRLSTWDRNGFNFSKNGKKEESKEYRKL